MKFQQAHLLLKLVQSDILVVKELRPQGNNTSVVHEGRQQNWRIACFVVTYQM